MTTVDGQFFGQAFDDVITGACDADLLAVAGGFTEHKCWGIQGRVLCHNVLRFLFYVCIGSHCTFLLIDILSITAKNFFF